MIKIAELKQRKCAQVAKSAKAHATLLIGWNSAEIATVNGKSRCRELKAGGEQNY